MVLHNRSVCSPMENMISPTLSISKMSVVLCMVLRSSRLFTSSLAGVLLLPLFTSCLQSCYWDSMCVMSDMPWRHTLTENRLILKLTTFLLPLLQRSLSLRYRSYIRYRFFSHEKRLSCGISIFLLLFHVGYGRQMCINFW